MKFLQRLLMQKGADFKLRNRLLLAQEIEHQKRLVKIARDKKL